VGVKVGIHTFPLCFGRVVEGVEAGVAAGVEEFPAERLFVCP
jgi:hypothetical protein